MTTLTDLPGAAELRAELAYQLALSGAITSRRWRDAFEAIPRHLFVPLFARSGDSSRRYTADDPDWLQAAYADDSLVTQWDTSGTATSSSSQPTVMARMLEMLDATPGVRVLEVGTGTGYNSALLCHGLGDRNIVSIDVDPGLVDQARDRLTLLGYLPTLAAGDGLAGYPAQAPYDRIIGTCATHRIPAAWLGQVRPGGIIVTSVGHGTVALTVTADRVASGRFHPDTAVFMPARRADAGPGMPWDDKVDLVFGDGETRATALLADVFDDHFQFAAAAVVPNLSALWSSDNDWYAVLDTDSRAWARGERADGGATVVQGGPRRLWDELELAHAWWTTAGRPGHDRLGLTVDRDGTHTLWVDDPDRHALVLY